MRKMETSSRHKGTEIEYKVDTGNDINLMPVTTFKSLFPRATVEQLAKFKDKSVILHTYQNKHT